MRTHPGPPIIHNDLLGLAGVQNHGCRDEILDVTENDPLKAFLDHQGQVDWAVII